MFMKKPVFLSILIMILFSLNSFSRSGMGQICFIRPGGYTASEVKFRVFIDDSLACKLKNKSYSTHTVKAGDHTVAGRNTGLTMDKASTPFNVKVVCLSPSTSPMRPILVPVMTMT